MRHPYLLLMIVLSWSAVAACASEPDAPAVPASTTRTLRVPCGSLFDVDSWTFVPGLSDYQIDTDLDVVSVGRCIPQACPEHAVLDETFGTCSCQAGYHASGHACAETLVTTWPVHDGAELDAALAAAATDRYSVVELLADVDLSTPARRSRALSERLSGTIHGNGHALIGYRSERPLFEYLAPDSQITDLQILALDVFGSGEIGGLATRMHGASLRGVHVTGVVAGGSVGACLVATASLSHVEGSSFEGDVASGDRCRGPGSFGEESLETRRTL